MDHAPTLLVALTVVWLSGRWRRSLEALRVLRAASSATSTTLLHSPSSRRGPRLASAGRGGAPADQPAPASVRLEVGYSTPLPALRAHVCSVLARHPLWDGGHSAMQVVDATPASVVLRLRASVTAGADARRLEADLHEAVLLFLARHCPESLDDADPAPVVRAGMLDR